MRDIERDIRREVLMPSGTIYLDNAATTPRMRRGLERMNRFYRDENANIHRGSYPLSSRATDAYEYARKTISSLLFGSDNPQEVVFTHGATEAANLLARGLANRINCGDNIVVTVMEHHSNLLPWRRLTEEHQAQLRIIPLAPDGTLDVDIANKFIDANTRVLAMTAMSNVTGNRPDIEPLSALARKHGSLVIFDMAQAAAHERIDISGGLFDAAFVSSHKLGGPMGVGALWAREQLLNELDPWILGGGVVQDVQPDGCPSFLQTPLRLEAGTQDVAGTLGFAEALAARNSLSVDALFEHERSLARSLRSGIQAIPGLGIVGGTGDCPIIALSARFMSPYDLGTVLAQTGISARCGKHCAHPYLHALGIPGVCRLSLSFANTQEEIDRTIEALTFISKRFRGAR